MAKRPSVIGNLSLTPPMEAPALAAVQAPSTNVVDLSTAPAAKRAPKKGVKHTSLYLPAPVDRKLKEIALTNDSNRHDVIMEGIDLILAKYGTSIAKLTTPTS